MKFLADEDFPKPLVIKIRKQGFSVKTIQQKNLQGASDEIVTNIAIKEKRIALTFDKDFLKSKGRNLQVIIFSFPKTPTSEIIPLIETFLKNLPKELMKGKILRFSKHGFETISYILKDL